MKKYEATAQMTVRMPSRQNYGRKRQRAMSMAEGNQVTHNPLPAMQPRDALHLFDTEAKRGRSSVSNPLPPTEGLEDDNTHARIPPNAPATVAAEKKMAMREDTSRRRYHRER